MRLSTTLFGQTFQFSSIKEVLAKANEEKSGDVLAGIAAASGLERIAAKEVLSNLLVSDLREEFDYILLDCPAGIERGFKNAVAGADRAFVVTTPEVSAIRDADRIIGLLEAEDMDGIDLIVNRVRMDMVRRGDMMSVGDVVDILAVNMIGAIPDDESIVVSANQGEPLAGTQSLAGQAYMNICRRIVGENVPLMNLEASRSFLSRLSGLLKRA